MNKKITTATIKKMKKNNQKISMLTAYDFPTAKILDESGIEIILVGDSLGMVVLGYNDTTQVTITDIIHHSKAVSRGTKNSLIVADMPFLSYSLGEKQSVSNAGRLIQEGHAEAVKLEGGQKILKDVKAIINAGIPVMGHLGLTPQSIHQLGGYFVQGKTTEQAQKILQDAKALENAGVFAIVLECVPSELTRIITKELSIPTIGIGAGIECDGQVLVTHDLIGMYPKKTPKFVKQYSNISEIIQNSVTEYIQEVKNNKFPEESHQFHIDNSIIKNLY